MEREIGIVGAGVIGLGIGWELARRGASVTIYERDTPGSGASHAAAGMLAPTAEFDFQEAELLELGLQSLDQYPGFVSQLEEASSERVDYRQEGTLVIAVDRDDAEALEHIHDYHNQLGLDAERLSTQQAREMEPGLDPSVHGAVLCKSDHQVDPRRLVDALAGAFRQAGGRLRTHTEVEGLELDANGHAIRTANGESESYRDIIVCAGVWSTEIEGIPEGVLPHLRPVRGQMLAVDLDNPPICEHVLRVPDPSRLDVYLVPKSDGRLLIGATSEERGFDPHLTAGGVFELLRGAWEALPGVYDRDLLDMWTGFRPVTLDETPVVGPTDVEGLWLAVGHGRHGILQTPVTATALADAIESGAIPSVIEDFTPASQTR